MEINLETISEFINLKRSKKFNLLVTIFSTIVSGFLIILVLNPNYVKGLSAFLVFILSLAAIAPIYIFNQIVSIFLISKLLKIGLQRIANVAKTQDTQETEDESIQEFTDDITNELVSKAFYNSPVRQLSELITIVACYISALLSWIFGIGIFGLYLLLTTLSIFLFFLTYKLLFAIISKVKQQHLKRLIGKLKKDKAFMEYLESRLNNIERLIKEKKEG